MRVVNDGFRVAAALVKQTILAELDDFRRHPLGWLYVHRPLGAHLKLSFHVWPDDWHVAPEFAGGEIHEHAYHLYSLVVLGTIRNQTFRVVPAAGGAARVAEVRYHDSGSSVNVESGALNLEVVEQGDHGAGCFYTVQAGTFHRASAVERPAVTLVLRQNVAGGRSRIVMRDGEIPPPDHAVLPLSPAQRESLRDIALHL
jgi:hypothetical protein